MEITIKNELFFIECIFGPLVFYFLRKIKREEFQKESRKWIIMIINVLNPSGDEFHESAQSGLISNN